MSAKEFSALGVRVLLDEPKQHGAMVVLGISRESCISGGEENKERTIMRGHQALAMAALGLLLAGGSTVWAADPASPAVLTVVPAQKAVVPGGKAEVHVFLSNASNVAAYELHMSVLGEQGQTLALSAMSVDKTRKNFIFGNDQIVEAFDVKGKRAAIVKYGQGVDVPANEVRYLGTFTYDVPADAKGTFKIGLNSAESFVSNMNVEQLPIKVAEVAEIKVGELSRTESRDRKR